MDGLFGAYIGVGVTGLVHGLEPGHGWPLAVLLSRQKGRSVLYASISALILGLGHLVSSFAVVGVYLGASQVIDFSSSFFRYIAAGVLLLIAARMWREVPKKEGGGQKKSVGLVGLAWMALILGFAHEEEFMLLALAVGGLNPVTMMGAYAVAVILSMVAITVAAFLAFQRSRALLTKGHGPGTRGVERFVPRRCLLAK